jgi:hypothetical protein
MEAIQPDKLPLTWLLQNACFRTIFQLLIINQRKEQSEATDYKCRHFANTFLVSSNIMRISQQITPVIILAFLLGCSSPSNQTNKPAFQKGRTSISKAPEPVDTPRSFVRNYGVNDNNPLFAFVGEKIWVEPLPSKLYSFDNGFKAKYAVLQKVFGDFPSDTIEFVAYDHYGIPPFSKFNHVLLYVSSDSGTYYQQKYMFNDVYKTREGRWAGSYADDYEHEYNEKTKVKPMKIDFAQTVYYPTKIIDEEGRTLTRIFSTPYFQTHGDSAIAKYGNYVEDLFILKRDGYLTARKIFKKGKIVQ